ncbi:gas vesicle protein [Shouchella patagoniensis]|uniref:gas vesicle protein n=1 Tax=Shouchella patagoniensis TaxID=228576 RepID=UPI000994D51D|nr:gas vesicle protein [Shouchella patagoniensis]
MNTRETIDRNQDVTLIDILDVILDKGVAIKGDLIISIAGVDLVYLDLRVLIASVETLVQAQSNHNRRDITSEEFDRQKEELVYVSGDTEKWENSFRS